MKNDKVNKILDSLNPKKFKCCNCKKYTDDIPGMVYHDILNRKWCHKCATKETSWPNPPK